MIDFTAARRTMVDNQIRTYDVTDQRVLAAFEAVPREDFVDQREIAVAYLDREPPARNGNARLLTPMVLARMLQALSVEKGERVLDVAGAGYGAALLRALGAEVTEAGDAAGRGPFDAILVHGAADAVPSDLIRQLRDGGRLIVVIGRGRSGRATLFRKIGDGASGSAVFDAAAPLLSDLAAKPAFQF